MKCSNSRESDEARALAALERMDDKALAAVASMMEEMAEKHPREQLNTLRVVQKPTG